MWKKTKKQKQRHRDGLREGSTLTMPKQNDFSKLYIIVEITKHRF